MDWPPTHSLSPEGLPLFLLLQKIEWPQGVPRGEHFLLLLRTLPAPCFQGLRGGPCGHLGTPSCCFSLRQGKRPFVPGQGSWFNTVHFHKSGVPEVQKSGPLDQQVWCRLPENARKTAPGTRGWARPWREPWAGVGTLPGVPGSASFLVPWTPCLPLAGTRPECDVPPWKHLPVPR